MMTTTNGTRLVVCLLVSLLSLGIGAGCGGSGGDDSSSEGGASGGELDPSNFGDQNEWGIEVSGATSFLAIGESDNEESSASRNGNFGLVEGLLRNDDSSEAECSITLDFSSEFDRENPKGSYSARGTLHRYDEEFGQAGPMQTTVAKYSVDSDDEETYLEVDITKWEEIGSGLSLRFDVAGTFEGKLVHTENEGEYVTVRGTFDFIGS